MSPPQLTDVNPNIARLLAAARTAFSRGFRQALNAPPDALPLLLNEPVQTRGFALEGAAMALVMMDELSSARLRLLATLLTGRSEAEQTLCAIGVGWAGARLGRSSAWMPPELDHRYMHAVADGYGFHQGFFHSHRFTGRGFPKAKSELNDAYDIGLGRALWFVHLGRVKPVAGDIGKMPPDRRMQLWRGVGTACAFTGSSEYATAQLCTAAVGFENHFWAGLETGTQLLRALAQQAEEETL